MDDVSSAFEAASESAKVDSSSLDRLHELCDEAIALEAIVESMENDLSAIKANLNGIKTKKLPDIMKELSLEKIVRNGREISIHNFVSGSLPKEEDCRADAIKWLEDNGGAGLIKTELSMSFGKGERDAANRTFEMLKKSTNKDVHMETGVHASTLQSFAREKLKKGEEIDTDKLGLFTGSTTKIKVLKG